MLVRFLLGLKLRTLNFITAFNLRPAHTGGHIAATSPFLQKSSVERTEFLNDPNFQCRIMCAALANCPRFKIARTNRLLAIP